MHRHLGLRAELLAVAAAAVVVAGCMSGKPSSASTSDGASKGVVGQYYFVNLFTPPIGGVVASDPAGINCGASSLGTPTPDANGVLQYAPVYYTGADQCGVKGQTRYPWSQTVVLTATAQGTNAFIGWAGDCSGDSPTCTLKAGADKAVVAIFGPAGSGHPNYTSPSLHGPAYFDFLARGAQAPLQCTKCHGGNLQGQGNAPPCNTCHEAAGWTGWSTNCSFCHGAKDSNAKQGYSVASHPTWSAPPDAVSQRLSGTPAPDRTGAHKAHLTGATAAGLQFAAAFTCQTCHAVPSDLSHIGGPNSRATVALSGAGQAYLDPSLGTYSQGNGTCTTYCHGTAGSPAWSATGLVCGDCHGVPPAPSTGHPAVSSDRTGCVGCHPGTMNGDGSLNLGGGLHLNGIVEATGGHGDFTAPSTHAPRFFDYLAGMSTLNCQSCHGPTYGTVVQPLNESCNTCHAKAGWTGWTTNCSFCHGVKDPVNTMPGYSVASHPTWSSPPDAVSQRLSGTAAPDRTGAHKAHLTGATAAGLQFAAAFTCQTCHTVPADLSHIDGSMARAKVTLSGAGQASLPASLGSYTQGNGTCTTYCHGTAGSPAWATTGLVCGDCHGVPPAPSTGHPAVSSDRTGCVGCHPGTMNGDGSLNLGGGLHLNGIVEATGGHGDFTAPSTHAPRFFDYLGGIGTLNCQSCHGSDYGTVVQPLNESCNTCHAKAGWTGWNTNCSFCHGATTAQAKAGYVLGDFPTLSAPPDDIQGRLTKANADARTGAHQAHLTGIAKDGQSYAVPFACQTCHAVPVNLSHVGGSTARATVALASGTYSQATGTCATTCHGTVGSPAWSGVITQCNSCHGIPPDTGAPINGNSAHLYHWGNLNYSCQACHDATATWIIQGGVQVDVLKVDKTSHVNGSVNVVFQSGGVWYPGTGTCTATCHSNATMTWR